MTLVRHGATIWNATGRFQGHSDVALSELGRQQAEAVATTLRRERFDRVYSSDLARAVETARALAAPHRISVTQDTRLREFAFGDWEGLTWAEIVATRPHLQAAMATAAARYAPDGGETFDAVKQRVGEFLRDMCDDGARDVAIVTHAGPLHAIVTRLGMPSTKSACVETGIKFSPASITRITMEEGVPRLISLNDVRHLTIAR